MILYINAYFPGFATFIGELAAPAEFMSFVKDTYELNDPNTYAIYLKDIRAEPEKEYITPGSGYLKWEQVFYFDEDYSDYAYGTHLWGRTPKS